MKKIQPLRILRNRNARAGFTFVEILITLALFGILFIPVIQLFSQAMDASGQSRAVLTAVNLARWEAERTRNLGFDVRRLKTEGDIVWPPLTEPAYSFNGYFWRIYRALKSGSEPLEVTIDVMQEGKNKPMAHLVMLVCEPVWIREVAA